MPLKVPLPWFSLVFFFYVKLQVFGENNNVVVFLFQFPHLHAIGQLVVHPPSRIVSHPKDKKLP